MQKDKYYIVMLCNECLMSLWPLSFWSKAKIFEGKGEKGKS